MYFHALHSIFDIDDSFPNSPRTGSGDAELFLGIHTKRLSISRDVLLKFLV